MGVETSDSPQSVSVLRAQVLNAGSLSGGEDFEVCGFVDVFFDSAVVVDAFDEDEFLRLKKKYLIFRVADLKSVLSSNLRDELHGGGDDIKDSEGRDGGEKTN